MESPSYPGPTTSGLSDRVERESPDRRVVRLFVVFTPARLRCDGGEVIRPSDLPLAASLGLPRGCPVGQSRPSQQQLYFEYSGSTMYFSLLKHQGLRIPPVQSTIPADCSGFPSKLHTWPDMLLVSETSACQENGHEDSIFPWEQVSHSEQCTLCARENQRIGMTEKSPPPWVDDVRPFRLCQLGERTRTEK